MKGLFSRLFGPKRSASAENEIAAAIAVALQLYGMESAPKRAAGIAPLKARIGMELQKLRHDAAAAKKPTLVGREPYPINRNAQRITAT